MSNIKISAELFRIKISNENAFILFGNKMLLKYFLLFLFTVLIPHKSFADEFTGRVTNGKEPKYQTEEYKNRYSISCVSNVDNPSVFNSIEKKIPFQNMQFKKGTDMTVDQFIIRDNIQYLVGTIYVFAGSRVLSVARDKSTYSSEEEKYKLYVFPKEWDCSFYRGGREAGGGSCDAIIGSYKKMHDELNKCKSIKGE